jgi:hypothetical protein
VERYANITKYRERALDAAALIAALTTSGTESRPLLAALVKRQDDQLHDLLHDFAYNARKVFDRARTARLSLDADKPTVLAFTRGEGSGAGITQYSFRWVLGRIVHSEDLTIERSLESEARSLGPLIEVSAELGWGFVIQSDLDVRRNTRHFIFLEQFLGVFMALDRQLEIQLASAL